MVRGLKRIRERGPAWGCARGPTADSCGTRRLNLAVASPDCSTHRAGVKSWPIPAQDTGRLQIIFLVK